MNSLKERLISIRDNEWVIPNDIDRYPFALELLENIGTTDSELRDDLILNVLWLMITEKMLTKEQVRDLLEICLSDKHLFNKLGEIENDAVFNRTFTVLIIRAIIYYHITNGEDLLSKEEVINLNDTLIRYARLEKDLRGYVDKKGWAHAMGHSGDALRSMAFCNEIGHDDLMKIVEVVKEKICISDYVYINGEAERLVSTIIIVLSRDILEEQELIRWVNSFENTNPPKDYPEKHYYEENVKNFLRSLYFRIKFNNSSSIIIEEIEKTLNRMNEDYNKIA
ncbi:DUF2785 domain-containing protein [Mycoplasmatota bacterium]|nr:DUF2785 domain-containing protein [Mycoplasmatota bacterium]